jgi:sugar lactone lactonase YvrE
LIEVPTDLSGFTLFQTGKISFPDGIKSDGKGNLYIGALWTAVEYNIPDDKITKDIIVKGADGVSLVPGSY